ncbi:hypothetical protein G6O45_28705, partial [Salmonella enterica subsp. enterica serovar Istanbul]|nr:hypothetical protein [Salmonella enterica subsp. enterica serovar Istanbul]
CLARLGLTHDVGVSIVEERHGDADDRAHRRSGQHVRRVVHVAHHAECRGSGCSRVADDTGDGVGRSAEEAVLKVVCADEA